MVARIAPSPVTTSVASGDALTHAPTPSVSDDAGNRQQNSMQFESALQLAANNVPPRAPPGEAFAAAVIAGQLPPRPTSPEQLRQRLGSAWQPPASPLRLMDRSA
jgi:hypothetical protein